MNSGLSRRKVIGLLLAVIFIVSLGLFKLRLPDVKTETSTADIGGLTLSSNEEKSVKNQSLHEKGIANQEVEPLNSTPSRGSEFDKRMKIAEDAFHKLEASNTTIISQETNEEGLSVAALITEPTAAQLSAYSEALSVALDGLPNDQRQPDREVELIRNYTSFRSANKIVEGFFPKPDSTAKHTFTETYVRNPSDYSVKNGIVTVRGVVGLYSLPDGGIERYGYLFEADGN